MGGLQRENEKGGENGKWKGMNKKWETGKPKERSLGSGHEGDNRKKRKASEEEEEEEE